MAFSFGTNAGPVGIAATIHTSHSSSRNRSRSNDGTSEMAQDSKAGFSVLLIITNSVRHEFIWVPPGTGFWKLGERVCEAVNKSINCAADASTASHRTSPSTTPAGRILAMRVRWAKDPVVDSAWPQVTVVTESNYHAIMDMLRSRRVIGKFDALECDFSNWRSTIGQGEDRLPTYAEVDSTS